MLLHVLRYRQYYSSCKTGNMDSALSIWFLLLWLAGDSCNLAGSFLADQLPLQVRGEDDVNKLQLKVTRPVNIVQSTLCFCFLRVFQKYTAVYYVLADLLMLSMFSYYKVKNRYSYGES